MFKIKFLEVNAVMVMVLTVMEKFAIWDGGKIFCIGMVSRFGTYEDSYLRLESKSR